MIRLTVYATLILFWQMFGPHVFGPIILLACIAHVYFRARDGYWLFDDPPFERSLVYQAYRRIRRK